MPTTLPLFPLTTALVPGLVLPLHIFEPRYRSMIDSLLATEDEDAREFGVVAVRDGRSVEADGQDALYEVGTATVLHRADRLPDGRFDIVTTGSRRFRIEQLDLSSPLAQAQVTFLEDTVADGDERLGAMVARAFLAYRSALSGHVVSDPGDVDSPLPNDPIVISYLVTAAMILPTGERQELLSAASTADRLRRAHSLLRREAGLIVELQSLPSVEPLAPHGSLN